MKADSYRTMGSTIYDLYAESQTCLYSGKGFEIYTLLALFSPVTPTL